jgi:thiaminase/transcriptional activator TenA
MTSNAHHPLFARLKTACASEWDDYLNHPFVRRLGEGTLPEECFRHYLGQDYLFLIQFVRAYGLAVYKSDTLEDMRQGAAGMAAILDEMGLHVKYCHDWGITQAEMAALSEARATTAYTRYVLDKGASGDLLDLHVALAPCVIGYAEIGRQLRAEFAEGLDDNPYRSWIDSYAGVDYQALAGAQAARLDHLMTARGGPGRFQALAELFREAVRLETEFWEMGLTLAR